MIFLDFSEEEQLRTVNCYDLVQQQSYISIYSQDPFKLRDNSYDEILEALNIRENFTAAEIEVYPTADGLRVWGQIPSDSPEKPEIYFRQTATVTAKKGTKLYEAPGVLNRQAVTVPKSTKVLVCGSRYDQPDWLFVYYYDSAGYLSSGWLRNQDLKINQ